MTTQTAQSRRSHSRFSLVQLEFLGACLGLAPENATVPSLPEQFPALCDGVTETGECISFLFELGESPKRRLGIWQ